MFQLSGFYCIVPRTQRLPQKDLTRRRLMRLVEGSAVHCLGFRVLYRFSRVFLLGFMRVDGSPRGVLGILGMFIGLPRGDLV